MPGRFLQVAGFDQDPVMRFPKFSDLGLRDFAPYAQPLPCQACPCQCRVSAREAGTLGLDRIYQQPWLRVCTTLAQIQSPVKVVYRFGLVGLDGFDVHPVPY